MIPLVDGSTSPNRSSPTAHGSTEKNNALPGTRGQAPGVTAKGVTDPMDPGSPAVPRNFPSRRVTLLGVLFRVLLFYPLTTVSHSGTQQRLVDDIRQRLGNGFGLQRQGNHGADDQQRASDHEG